MLHVRRGSKSFSRDRLEVALGRLPLEDIPRASYELCPLGSSTQVHLVAHMFYRSFVAIRDDKDGF